MEGHGHMHPHPHHHHHTPHHHQQQLQQQQQQHQQYQQQMSGGGGSTVGGDAGDRFPQWSLQETKEFLIIRAELDRAFMETKRNKLLWEVISTKMREKGFHRSAEQCKCKWKNLVTRYKGCETMEPEAMRQQFPFYNEMQAIFTARMQMLWAEAEGGGGTAGPSSMSSSRKVKAQGQSSDDDEEEDSEGERGGGGGNATKKKAKRVKLGGGGGGGVGGVGAIREMLEEFMKRQMQMEVQWREAYEAREEERRKAEREWRQRMEALENERLGLERRWREREEQRRVREEARAEKRDALISALLNKLRRDDSNL